MHFPSMADFKIQLCSLRILFPLNQIRAQSYPVFQCQCNCANGMCAVSHRGEAVTVAYSVYENICSLTLRLHSRYTEAQKLDRIWTSVFISERNKIARQLCKITRNSRVTTNTKMVFKLQFHKELKRTLSFSVACKSCVANIIVLIFYTS